MKQLFLIIFCSIPMYAVQIPVVFEQPALAQEKVVRLCMQVHEFCSSNELSEDLRRLVIDCVIELHTQSVRLRLGDRILPPEDVQYMKFWFDRMSGDISAYEVFAVDLCLSKLIGNAKKLLFE